jgi:hypothetical protein
MPAFDIVELRLYCDRDWRATFAIYDAQGRAVAIGLTDIVYAKLALSEGSATPVIDVGSDSPLTGGSAVTITTRGDTSAPDPANWIPRPAWWNLRPPTQRPFLPSMLGRERKPQAVRV